MGSEMCIRDRTKPDSSSVDKSLLSRIKTELPGKVKEATKIEDEE